MMDEIEKQQLRILADLISSLHLQVQQLEKIVKELRLKSLEK